MRGQKMKSDCCSAPSSVGESSVSSGCSPGVSGGFVDRQATSTATIRRSLLFVNHKESAKFAVALLAAKTVGLLLELWKQKSDDLLRVPVALDRIHYDIHYSRCIRGDFSIS